MCLLTMLVWSLHRRESADFVGPVASQTIHTELLCVFFVVVVVYNKGK